MPPSSSPRSPLLAAPHWLKSHAGMGLACMWIAAVVVKLLALALIIAPATEAVLLASLVIAAATTALMQSQVFKRKDTVDPALRRSFRLNVIATLIFTACAVATAVDLAQKAATHARLDAEEERRQVAAEAAALDAPGQGEATAQSPADANASPPLAGEQVSTAAVSTNSPESQAPSRTQFVLMLISTLGSIPGLFIALGATVKLPGGEISRVNRAPAFLDLGTLLITSLLAFWIFALGPALYALLKDPTGAMAWPVIVIAVYAFVSVLILSMAMLIPFRSQDTDSHRGLGYIALGGVAIIIGDVLPLCSGFARQEWPPTPTFLGWLLFCTAFAIHARVSHEPITTTREATHLNLRFSMPFASIGLVAMVFFTLVIRRDLLKENIELLLPAVFIAFVFVIVRQTVIARENFGLALEMKAAKDIAESANSARLHFLANISHDLRTPLNGVLGCAQILLREKAFSAKNRELLKTIQGCGEHLRNLINDLLDLSKLEAGRLELAPSPFDLKAFLKALIKTFEIEADHKKIALDLEEAANLPGWVQCDRKRLQQILGNLVHNAIKFTDHGRVKVRARIAGPAMMFDVIDTGCGIMPDKVGELFQPFHVVDERSIKLEGTGLGLSISKKLANKMGGDIFVTSTLGKGSTFTVAIPLAEAAPVVEVQRTVVDYHGRRRRVLIVDDNMANRVVLRTMLEPLDFLIHEASDAPSAHEQIRQAKPDIILMDLMMPVTDGFTLCREVVALQVQPAPALIAVSAMAGDDVIERCRKAGFADLLNKPVHLESLVETLRAHAGVEWTYGVLQPPPETPVEAVSNEPFVAPPADEVTAFLELARRGVVRNIETRAEQLAHSHPEYTPFARRVARFAREFKLKELGEWLSSLSPPQAHGSA